MRGPSRRSGSERNPLAEPADAGCLAWPSCDASDEPAMNRLRDRAAEMERTTGGRVRGRITGLARRRTPNGRSDSPWSNSSIGARDPKFPHAATLDRLCRRGMLDRAGDCDRGDNSAPVSAVAQLSDSLQAAPRRAHSSPTSGGAITLRNCCSELCGARGRRAARPFLHGAELPGRDSGVLQLPDHQQHRQGECRRTESARVDGSVRHARCYVAWVVRNQLSRAPNTLYKRLDLRP
jgi:hypothetical protein